MPKVIEQLKPKISAPDNLEVLELKANLNSEQREHLDVLKAKMKKTLAGKTKQELATAGDLAALKNYKNILIEILSFLRTKEKSLEDKFELKKQYDEQFEILKETGVIKKLSNGQWSMIDILGQEQPIPSYEEIKGRLEAKAEMLEKKREQGFTKLLLVPIGMKLKDLAALAGNLILKKRMEGKLIATDGSELELNEKKPIYVNDEYKDADVNGSLVYGVKKFDKNNHGGQTKKELIENTGGWQIMFIEDLPDLPKKGKGKEIGDRNQLEAGLSPEEYLAKIQTEEQYADEQLTTPEAQLIYLFNRLHNHNQMIDDLDGQGKGCWNAGAYFKGTGSVSLGYWYRNFRQFRLNRDELGKHNEDFSVRASVII